MQSSHIALTDVRRALDVANSGTLRTWLHKLDITPQLQGKQRYITQEEFYKLREAVELHRALDWRASMTRTIHRLESHIDELESRARQQRWTQFAAQRATMRMLMATGNVPRLLQIAADYLDDAAYPPHASAHEITVALGPLLELALASAEGVAVIERWQEALSDAMSRGWTVRHLICQSSDLTNPMVASRLVTTMLRRFHEGRVYQPLLYAESDVGEDFWRLTSADGIEETQGYLSISGKQPLILSLDRPSYLLATNMSQVDLVTVRRCLYSAGSRAYSLYVEYEPTHPKYLELITSAEDGEGSRSLFMQGFSQTTVPQELHDERAKELIQKYPHQEERVNRIHMQYVKRNQLLDKKLARWKMMRSQARNSRFIRDFCPLSALERYIRTGELARDDTYGHLEGRLTPHPLSPQQVDAHLGAIIKRLSDYPHYELALVDDLTSPQSAQNALRWRPFWMVAEGRCVILEIHSATDTGEFYERDLLLQDAAIVEGFLEYTITLWENGEQVITDQNRVIDELSNARRHIDYHRTR